MWRYNYALLIKIFEYNNKRQRITIEINNIITARLAKARNKVEHKNCVRENTKNVGCCY